MKHLSFIHFDCIKIDRFFTKSIETSEENKIIANGIISIGSNLKTVVVAEGVETKEQIEILKNLNCNMIQGDYLFKPMDSNKLTSLLKSQK